MDGVKDSSAFGASDICVGVGGNVVKKPPSSGAFNVGIALDGFDGGFHGMPLGVGGNVVRKPSSDASNAGIAPDGFEGGFHGVSLGVDGNVVWKPTYDASNVGIAPDGFEGEFHGIPWDHKCVHNVIITHLSLYRFKRLLLLLIR